MRRGEKSDEGKREEEQGKGRNTHKERKENPDLTARARRLERCVASSPGPQTLASH